MKHKYTTDFPSLPEEKTFRIDKLSALVSDLDSVIRRFEKWGLRVSSFGRLRDARSTLQNIIDGGRYLDDETSLRRAAESIIVARDFGQIAEAIREDELHRIANELQHAVKGSLSAEDATRQPFQFQSQFWFGAALSRAGLSPKVPQHSSRRSPDFVVKPYACEYAIEVKRPASRNGAFDKLEQARDQLSEGNYPGIIAIDLSDCLEDIGLKRFADHADDRAHEFSRQAYTEFRDSLLAAAWDGPKRQHRPKYSHVFGIWLWARGWRWVKDNLEQPQMFEMQGFQTMASTKGNVWHHAGHDFFDRMKKGLEAGGLHIFAAEHESYSPVVPYWESYR